MSYPCSKLKLQGKAAAHSRSQPPPNRQQAAATHQVPAAVGNVHLGHLARRGKQRAQLLARHALRQATDMQDLWKWREGEGLSDKTGGVSSGSSWCARVRRVHCTCIKLGSPSGTVRVHDTATAGETRQLQGKSGPRRWLAGSRNPPWGPCPRHHRRGRPRPLRPPRLRARQEPPMHQPCCAPCIGGRIQAGITLGRHCKNAEPVLGWLQQRPHTAGNALESRNHTGHPAGMVQPSFSGEQEMVQPIVQC